MAEEGNENKSFLHPSGLVWKEPTAETAAFLRVSGRKSLTTVESPGGPGWPGGPCGPYGEERAIRRQGHSYTALAFFSS